MHLENEARNRLIVLLPQSLAGDLDFAQKISRLAGRARQDVLYLALLDDEALNLSVSRGLATMKAVTESDDVRTGSMQVVSRRWFAKLQQIFRPGDTVLVHREQTVQLGPFKTRPMTDYLAAKLTPSVVSVEGFYSPQRTILKSWLHGALFWLGALAILAGFTVLELQADTAFPGLAHKLVLGLILLVEFGAIWFWSRIVRR